MRWNLLLATVLALSGAGHFLLRTDPIQPNLEVLPSGFKLEWMDEPWRDVAESGRWALDLERRYGPDVVHLNSYGHGALAWRTPVVVTAHSCVLSWWRVVKGCPAPPSWDRYRDVVTATLQASRNTHSPMRTTRPVLSAIGMKSAGETMPRSGWFQRSRASKPQIVREATSNRG